MENLAHIALLIDDYDSAINYYTSVLNFDLVEDSVLSESKRWVLVKPKNSLSTSILLAKATNEEQKKSIGNQSGGRVFLFLHTTDFDAFFNRLTLNAVTIIREPVIEKWGKVAVFQDKYGNLWDLIEKI